MWRLRQAMTVVVNYWRMAIVGKTPRRTGALQRSIYGKVRVPGMAASAASSAAT